MLLLRRPVVLLAVVLATAVLSVAAASGVLFLSTIGTASLTVQAAADCPEASASSFSAPVPGAAVAAAETAGLDALRTEGGGQPYSAALGPAQIDATRVILFSRAGALDHVETLTPTAAGPGAWFPDNFATKLDLKPGDVVTTTAGNPIRVAGIYRALSPDPFTLSALPRYWCTWHDLIVPKVVENPAGPWLIADLSTVAAASDRPVSLTWYRVLPATTSLDEAGDAPGQAAAAAAAFEQRTGTPAVVDPQLGAKIASAHRVQNGMGGSVVPIALAAVIVAGLLVAGAGAFWATSRAREIRLLVARGVGPGPLAAKAVLETLPAALIGLVAGFFVALALVRGVGPTSVLAPGAPLKALGVAAAAVLCAMTIIAAIGAAAGRERIIGGKQPWERQVPWELALLAVGLWAGARVRSQPAVHLDHGVLRIDPVTFVFPLLAGTAVLLLIARVLGLALPWVGRAQVKGNAAYLALRRLAGSRAVVLGLVIGTALPCALLTYASAVNHGISSEVTAKYQTNLGAQHVIEVRGSALEAPQLDGRGTPVAVLQTDPILPDGTRVRILGVDPETFGRFAYVDGQQRRALDKIVYTEGVAVPAILVNAPAAVDATSVTVLSTQLTLDVVAQVDTFPGLRDGFQPMIVVDRAALAQVDPSADRDNQVWTTDADYSSALHAIVADHFTVLTELTSRVLVGNTGLLPVTWIFGYLRSLAVLIGLVSVAGLVFALAARSRRRAVSYVMSRRMGMRRATHVRSLVIELALAAGSGWLAGSAVGSVAYGLVYRSLDIYPDLPPPPSFAVPWVVLVITAGILAAVVLLAAVGTQLASDRARPADVLRLE